MKRQWQLFRAKNSTDKVICIDNFRVHSVRSHPFNDVYRMLNNLEPIKKGRINRTTAVVTVLIRISVSFIIAGIAVCAAVDFKLIADAVLVSIVQAIAIAVVVRFWIIAVARIRRCCIVVASSIVLAACDFILVADLVVIDVKQAVARTIFSNCGIGA